MNFQTGSQSGKSYVSQPGWSPDGNYIAALVSSSEGPYLHFGKVGEAPLDFRRFTGDWCYTYSWSPDNKLVCHAGDRFVAYNPDGTGEKLISYTSDSPVSAIWSPNSEFLLYVAREFDSPSSLKVYAVNPDGSRRREVAIDIEPIEGGTLSLSPDSQWLAYNSKANGFVNIHIVNVYDPFQHAQLTINAGDNFSPQWRP